MDSQTVRAKHKEFLFPCVANYYAEPVVITEAHGSSVKDLDGREYVDFFGGILTAGIGHSHPEFVKRIQDQVARLVHTSSVYPTVEQVTVAEKLTQITPGKLKKSFFTTSGTEADETAVMLAKIYTGQQEIIVLRHSYAGRSQGAIAITGQQPWRVLPTQLPGVKHALSPYCYRCPLGLEYPDCGIRCAQDIEDLIRTTTNGRPAAYMAEPIQGAGGFITPPKEYFEIAVGIVRKYGGVFICDEVQTGWGRTGDTWCGIEHWNVEPEIMTFAKSAANGFPVGITIANEEVANAFTGLSLSTFGGNPISMAAVDVTMDVMERENTPKRSAERGKQLRDALEEFKKRFPFIGDVRGMGLMQGMELVEDRKTKEPSPKKTTALLEAAKKHGLLIGKGGLYGNVLRIAPSMLISKAEVDDGCRRLEQALAEVR
ncbi:MAG TPA: aspartate aminotransferase family protein [Gemmatimonadales bacterium]|nr:aspartate aminotransferase family protein [Gemmatimonadales bacterium]